MKYGVAKESYGNYAFGKLHDTVEDAKKEAERLCRKEKQSFFVIEIKHRCDIEVLPVKWVKL